ncbi:LAFE_0B07074g1_1 [Lachancea fermentati]|uniref:ATP-dependent RNA helicase n=1 Tax=Lachancea fermentati TaxID=4955 RepID=A0A1G4M863_LACFM|nr:LAFE_0B07074g1_1 [Lachancea fermentati]
MSKSLSWNDLNCSIQPWIRIAIDSMGFETMTPVQASTIPMFSGNKDVVVESVTGSGKTVSFVIPILQKLFQDEENNCKLKKGHFFALIISPTRELSSQIQSVINSFLSYLPEDKTTVHSQLLVGTNSASVRDDLNDFFDKRPQILVGTPGRVLDFLKNATVKTSSCAMVVLDEADKLLDVTFEKDIESILNFLPKQRRTGLFSATLSSAGADIFKTGMTNPVRISVKSKMSAPGSLKIHYMTVKPRMKLQLLVSILKDIRYKKCIVYFPTCVSVTYFYSFLKYLGENSLLNDDLHIYSLHGKLQTSSRMTTLANFVDTLSSAVLLTTDVAARGIDIPDVDLVIQFDPPTDPDMFLHRCGRTGRANRNGKAITFLNEGREEDYVHFLRVKNIQLDEIIPDAQPIDGFENRFKKWVLHDRARFDHGIKAYVAFIRYYSKHSASSIFRLASLDYIGLAKLYGLIRLPRMPEITRNIPQDEIPEAGWLIESPINLDEFSYLNKQMELARIQNLDKSKEVSDKRKLKSELKKKNMAWSNKLEAKESKVNRKQKLAAKRKAIEEKISQEGSGEDSATEEDWKELVRKNKRKKTSSAVQGNFADL